MTDNTHTDTEELRRQIEEITYWMYESSGNSKYVLAGRKPLHPDEATDKLFQLFTTQTTKLQAEARIDELKNVSDHLGFDSNDRYLDTDLYSWIWTERVEELKREHGL